ncbi:cytochrome c-551 [Jeotgalicoccus coquinae]|uniref:Cytochrome c-551 n=1 Tax=Jeotgalicoccus coquinae TaxID=709509 RepID=A0A6V7RMZ9_9STAP|nr:cytochrome c [Jeotgalicoccus coquinae]MBB6422283.1 cytochrome c551 [Jeotgalicoccus coquinae]GGE17150.1 cytochrome c-551 [Jeotgalicoccus coquinae]CAD2079090.1 Cytochrome c-551 precursor [Jeotgalicoccus coquinae]
MKKMLLTAGFSFVLLLGACGGNEEDTEEAAVTGDGQATVEDGERVYRATSCFSCHGADLEGASGPNLQEVGSRLDADQIRTVIVEGTDVMPGGMVEDPEDLDALVEWLSDQK